MTASVSSLLPVEQVLHDSAPVALMYRNMGAAAAEEVVGRALGELALTLAGLEAFRRTADGTGLARQLRRLQRMAEQLGLITFGRVAGDAQASLAAGDGPALAAIWARLMRVAELSLTPDAARQDLGA